MKLSVCMLLFAASTFAQDWKPLYDGKTLNGWEQHGNCLWTPLPDGILLGQRVHKNAAKPEGLAFPVDSSQFSKWAYQQAWLYTKATFTNFDLSLEYLIPPGLNSGVSLRDRTRGKFVTGEATAADGPSTGSPAHNGYEIQIIDGPEKYPTGSVYLFDGAKFGGQKSGQWNTMVIENRADKIRVKLNGEVVSESAGDPKRPTTGPIGLQLHDQFTIVMFRDIKIREY
jgi:hypothetical protein